MATLQKIRDRGVLLVIVLGVALLAFILGDLLTSGTTLFNKTKDKAFVVNGDIVSTTEYFDTVSEWEEFQKMMNGENSLNETTTAQIREAVFQQMVSERILNSEAKKIGLTVSKEEINDLVHGENISPILTQQVPFFIDPQTGVFNKNMMVEFLNNINNVNENASYEEKALVNRYKSLWLFIEKMIKYQHLQEKYNMLLTNAIMVNDAEAKSNFDLSKQNADMIYVAKNYYAIADSLCNVSEKEIKEFYDQNKEVFKMNVPMAKISYFTREIQPSDDDFAEVEKEAHKAYEQLKSTSNVATVVADYSETPYHDIYVSRSLLSPEQISFVQSAEISQIHGPVRDGNSYKIYQLIDQKVAPDSIRLQVMAVPETMGQDSIITHFVDSLYNVIKEGTSFADVANSLNPQSNGGDIGWVREIDLLALGTDVTKTVFDAPIGELHRMKVPGQRIIFQVKDKSKPVKKYKLATIDMPVLVSEKTSNNVDNELNQFVSSPDINKNFNTLAVEKNYQVMPSYSISAQDFMLAQIPNSRQIINWAVNEKKMGTVRKFDLTNLRVIARVDNVYSAGTAPLSEVSSSIRARLMNEKKAEKIIAQLNGQNLNSIDDYATAMDATTDTVRFVNFNTQNITGVGYEPKLNAFATFAPINQVMKPVKGNMGVYVVEVINRTQEEGEYNAETQKNTMLGRNFYRIQQQALNVLRDMLGVEDNRYRFF